MFLIDSVEVQAPPAVVWNSLVNERASYRTRIECPIGNTYVMHQTFETPLGPTNVTFLMVDQPFKKMDFLLTESDEIKDLKGSWNFIPTTNGKTRLELVVDKLKLKRVLVPEWILKKIFLKISHNRLTKIKEKSEQ